MSEFGECTGTLQNCLQNVMYMHIHREDEINEVFKRDEAQKWLRTMVAGQNAHSWILFSRFYFIF